MSTQSDVIEACKAEDIELVRLLHSGYAGMVRGRTKDADDIEDVLEGGTNMAKVVQGFTPFNTPTEGGRFGASGEIRLIPDPDTFQKLPYAESTAVMLCDKLTVDGKRWDADPRTVLGDFIDDLEYTPMTAYESEYFLVEETEDGYEPFDTTQCYTADGMQSAHEIILDTIRALKAQGMNLDVYYSEGGFGQQELVIDPGTGLQAPDNHVLYRQTAKAIAAEHGVKASFLPKPFQNDFGSGCHMNVSLWDGDRNAFYDSEGGGSYDITDTCRHFIGGLLEHAKGLVALTAPSVISYKRLQPHSWSGAFTAWGYDNREGFVRVPSTQWEDPESTARIELKAADNTANPYLSLLGILAAGKDGIDRENEPGEPVDGDPGALTQQERDRRDIARLPETLGEALEELESDEVLVEKLGETLVEGYVAEKRTEWNNSKSTVSEWDIETYGPQF